MAKRNTAQIFDRVFKRLIRSSGPAVIHLINGLFDTRYPPDSPVEYPGGEYVNKKLRALYSDMVIVINGVHVYQMEAQISDDAEIALRVFEYGFQEGQRTKTVQGNVITIPFPQAKILYWESGAKTPDTAVLRLIFPDGNIHEYRVDTFKVLDHPAAELERRKMVLLLPFYTLKYRKMVKKARSEADWRIIREAMQKQLEELLEIAGRSGKTGLLGAEDVRLVVEYIERLHYELYQDYNEKLMGVDMMVKDYILTYSEEAALEAEKRTEKRLEEKYRDILTYSEEAALEAERRTEKRLEEKYRDILTQSEKAALEAEKRTEKRTEKKCREESARKMKADGFTVDQIVKYTGLTRKEAEAI
jgi:hypothetical protein